MVDDTRQPDGGTRGSASIPSAPDPAAHVRAASPIRVESPPKAGLQLSPEGFEQLRLDPTIIGPGRRTEDLYEPGTKLKVEGQRGTFVYRYATVSRAGLVSLHLTQDGLFRAVRPEQVAPLKKNRSPR